MSLRESTIPEVFNKNCRVLLLKNNFLPFELQLKVNFNCFSRSFQRERILIDNNVQ